MREHETPADLACSDVARTVGDDEVLDVMSPRPVRTCIPGAALDDGVRRKRDHALGEHGQCSEKEREAE
jgi:hypothetical protein